MTELSSDIGSVRNEARQAAAIGLAAPSLRYDNTPGKISVAMGGGAWEGQGATAFGAGYTSESGKVRANRFRRCERRRSRRRRRNQLHAELSYHDQASL